MGLRSAAAGVVAIGLGMALAGCGAPAGPSSATQLRTAAAAVAATLRGVPQAGDTLGVADAPTVVTLYADPSCVGSGCDSLAGPMLATIVRRWVRTGQARLVLRPVNTPGFPLGGQLAAIAAGAQDHGWDFALLSWRAGSFAVDASVIGGALPGVDAAALRTAAASPEVRATAARAQALALARGGELPRLYVDPPGSGAGDVVSIGLADPGAALVAITKAMRGS